MTDIENQCIECFLLFKNGEEDYMGPPEEVDGDYEPCCPSCDGQKIVSRRIDGKIQRVKAEEFKHE